MARDDGTEGKLKMQKLDGVPKYEASIEQCPSNGNAAKEERQTEPGVVRSSRLRDDRVIDKKAYKWAALIVREAVDNSMPIERWHSDCEESALHRRGFYSKLSVRYRMLAMFGLLILSMFERPYNCDPSPMRPTDCTGALPTEAAHLAIHVLDFLIYTLAMFELFKWLQFQGRYMVCPPERDWRKIGTWCDWWRCIKATATIVSLILWMLDICTERYTGYWARCLIKPILLLEVKPSIRRRLTGTLMLIPRIAPTIVLAFGLMLWFATLVEVLVNHTDLEGAKELRDTGMFTTLGTTLTTLFYLLTADMQPMIFLVSPYQLFAAHARFTLVLYR